MLVSDDFLTEMARSGMRRAGLARSRAADYRHMADSIAAPKSLDADSTGFGVIAETKLASPALGRLASDGDDLSSVVRLANDYEQGGAVAVSVLTVPERFDGSIDHLSAVADSVGLPVMRKDFLLDPVQVLESRAQGASGVLLIARLLGSGRLAGMVDFTLELGMFCLVELFDEGDLDVASAVFDRDVLIGVNARDLSDLSVDPTRLERMAALLPETRVRVAESGVRSSTEVGPLVAMGYQLALVGTSLVTSSDPGRSVSELTAAGRRAVSEVAS